MSIDALAMAGADYRESDITFIEMEFRDMENTPQHLLAENEYNKMEEKRKVGMNLSSKKPQLNAKIQPWKRLSLQLEETPVQLPRSDQDHKIVEIRDKILC